MTKHVNARRWTCIGAGLLTAGLWLVGCERPPEKLVEDLGDPQTLVQEKARQALRDMGSESVPYLLAGIGNEAARDNIVAALILNGEAAVAPTLAALEQHCADEPVMDGLIEVVLATATPTEILDAYVGATRENRCSERKLLGAALTMAPPKDDVTVDITENYRYKPVRFAVKEKPEAADCRALARLCLYDEDLGSRVADMTRDKDEEVYWHMWREGRDPLVRAALTRYLNEVIWDGYYDNFIPEILAAERKADENDPVMLIGEVGTLWRKRANGKAVATVPAAHAALKAHYAASPGLFDEQCLIYRALEQMTVPMRGALDDKKRKREIEALDEALTALATDREAACTAANAYDYMPIRKR